MRHDIEPHLNFGTLRYQLKEGWFTPLALFESHFQIPINIFLIEFA